MKRAQMPMRKYSPWVILPLLIPVVVSAQPPEPGNADNPVPGRWLRGNGGIRVIQKNGKTTVEILDDKGNVIQKREFDWARGGGPLGNLFRPPRPPFPGGGDGGPASLAVSKKYVFVLLNGTLYQYDIDTLKLKNKVRVEPNGGFRLQVLPRPKARERRPRLGIGIAAVDEKTARQHGLDKPTGVRVQTVAADSPAAKGGIQPGDLILKYNGKEITSPETLMDAVRAGGDKDTATVVLLRGKRQQTITVRFGPAAGALAKPAKPTARPRKKTRPPRTTPPAPANGPTVNFDVNQANLRDVLHMLSAQTGTKIICAKGVHDTVSATLKNMPLEAALDSLLKPRGLTWRKTGRNTYLVEPATG